MRVTQAICALFLLCVGLGASPVRKHPRYIFILPDGYVGWVQVIFGDPSANPLPMQDGGYVIDVPESGICRSSDFRVQDFSPKAANEFYYRSLVPRTTAEKLQSIPAEYILRGVSQGGFGVGNTGGKGSGYSWFLFIGPPSLRAKEPLGDWDKVVDEWSKIHGNPRVQLSGPYPAPGRMKSGPPAE